MNPRRFAWLVLIPSDEQVSAGILSGKSLQATKTTGDVLAVVSNTLSSEKLDLLEETFDLVVVRRIPPERKGMKSLDALLLSCATLSSVRRGIVLAPGVLVASQVDHLFDTEEDGILAVSSSQQWLAFLLSPNSYQTNKLSSKATLDTFEDKVVLEQVFKEADRERPIVSIELQENNLDCWKSKGGDGDTHRSAFFHLREGAIPMEPQPGALWNPEPTALHHVEEKDLVAVVGMACRFPQANNLEEYWTILENGDCTVGTAPPDRLRLLNALDGTVKANFLSCGIDEFDAKFFAMSPAEAGFTDPQARLLLEVSWEALENAGVNPETLRGTRAGVYYGSWLQDYREAMDQDGYAGQDTLRKYLANGFGSSSAKLSYFYGLTGPNVSNESGCSSSLVACHLALKSLLTRECNMAMVCGSNLILNLGRQAKVWSPDGLSKSFDVGADGYSRAEGVAVLLLKRFGDALRDGNIVHGLIRGSAVSQEGMSKSFGSPTSESEAAAMREALRVAGVDPSQVDYVEAHATGTGVGDPVEAEAIAQVYRSSDPRPAPLWVGSGKTNIGHTESCSGLAGLIKVLLAMKKEKIPKHIHLTQLNPAVKWDQIPAKIPLETQPWPRNERRVRMAGVSSFGITGTDVHLIVQEPPQPPAPDTESKENMEKERQLLLISAKSEGALKELMVNYATFLMTTSQRLKDVCFTAATCRAHHRPYRLSFSGSTKEEMCDQLQQPERLDNCLRSSKLKATATKIVLSFPGMIGNTDLTPVRELFKTSPFVRQMMTEADALFLRMCPDRRSLIETLYSPEFIATSPVEYFFLVPTVQYVLAKLWMRWGLSPDLVIGHCHGELAGLLICGTFSLENVYSLVPLFQRLILCGQSRPTKFLAVNLNTAQTENYVNEFLSSLPVDVAKDFWLDIACMNHSQQTVVAGPDKTVESFFQYCEQKNARPKQVSVVLTAHCRWVEEVRDLALDTFSRLNIRPGKIPFLSSITGQLHHRIDPAHMYRNLRENINFPATCATLAQSFVAGRETVVIIEVGTSSLLTKFTRKNLAEMMPENDAAYFKCLSTFQEKDTRFMGTLQAVYEAGVNLRWDHIYEDWSSNVEGFRKVSVPSYPFQRKPFWYKKESRSTARMAPMINPQLIVHPLLGRVLSGPGISTDKLIFSNESFEQVLSYGATRFLEDHVLGEMIILPAAAFLEMVLAAGSYDLKSQTLHVVDFKIHAPLLLSNEMELSLQTILEKEADSRKISVYSSLVSGAGVPDHNPWRLHVTATLLPSEQEPVTLAAPHLELLPPLCDKKATLFYDRLCELGLQFGAAFKSLKRLGSVENEEGNYVVASLVPGGDQEEFLCHPVLADAMIQAAMISKHPDLRKLHIPVKIASFHLLPDTRNELTSDDKNKWLVIADKRTRSVYLVDSVTRAVRAVMNSPELLPTNVEAVRRAAGQGQNSTDHRLETFLESWEPTSSYQPSELVAPNNRRYVTNDKIAALQAREDQAMSVGSPALILDSRMTTLCFLYITKAMRTLGLDNVDALSTFANKPEQIGIIAPHLQSTFRHYVAYVSAKDSPWPCKLEQPMDVLEREISSILEEPIVKEYRALQVISHVGENLAALLLAQLSLHKILFDRDNKIGQYYRHFRFGRGLGIAREIFVDLLPCQAKQGTRTTLRILEVGAGTGVFTKVALPVLLESKTPFEYHFTDISPTLLSQTRAALEKEYPLSSSEQQLLFRVLNLENDPLEQGYPLDYYDLVVAVDVLHATKNLLESMSHLRQLCRAGASMIILETLRPVPEFDLTFGMLEGFWRFEDTDLRSSHCTISNEKWLQLLAKVGFTEHQGSVISDNGQKSVIFAATPAMEHVTEQVGNPEGDKSTWLVFEIGDDGATNICNQTLVPYLKHVTASKFERIKIYPELKGDQLKAWVRDTLVPYIPSSAAQLRNKLTGAILWLNAPQLKGVQNEVTRSFMEPILVLTQELLSATKSRPKLLLVTPEQNNPYTGMAWGFMRNILVEVPGLKAKCVELDTSDTRWTEYLCTELWVDDKETEVVGGRTTL